jgi:undecaprenyl diphosphate synthase
MPAADLSRDGIPRHVAIIMDGNGRWAQARGLERNAGHRAGLEAVRDVVRGAGEFGVEYLTLYAFSSENWNRPRSEVDELMHLLEHYLEEDLPEVLEEGVRVRAVGRLDKLPPSTRAAVEKAANATRHNRDRELLLALSYGGRTEIVDAVRRLVRAVEEGVVDPARIDEKVFQSQLYAPDVPDPDLLIRTGAESRISNFLLWQIAYAEIHMSSRMWPDFRREHLWEAIIDYQARERRFGLTSAQVKGGGEAPGK